MPRSRASSTHERGGGEILHGEAERLEERQLVVRPSRPGAPDEELAQLGQDVVGPDPALGDGSEVVPRLVDRRLAPVDEQRGLGDDVRLELSCPWPGRADGVDVGARREVGQRDDRLGRRRAGADDVRARERLVDGRAGEPVRLERERLRVVVVPAPDPELRVGQHLAHRDGVRAALDARAEDRDVPAVGPGEELRRDGGHRRRPDLRDGDAFRTATSSPGRPVVEQDGALMRIEPADAGCRGRRRPP